MSEAPATPTGRPRVHHVAVSVADLDATVSWYQETLGCREELRYDVPEMGLRAAFLALGEFRMEVFEVRGSRPAPHDGDVPHSLGVHGLQHVALAVDDVDRARSDLEGRGVRFVSGVADVPDSGGARFCLFLDPDGVLLELFEPAPRGSLSAPRGSARASRAASR